MKVKILIPAADSYGKPISPSLSLPGGNLYDALDYVRSWDRQIKPGTKITIEVE